MIGGLTVVVVAVVLTKVLLIEVVPIVVVAVVVAVVSELVETEEEDIVDTVVVGFSAPDMRFHSSVKLIWKLSNRCCGGVITALPEEPAAACAYAKCGTRQRAKNIASSAMPSLMLIPILVTFNDQDFFFVVFFETAPVFIA